MAIDAGLKLLNDYGYNLIQRHEVRLDPLDVLGRDEVLERLGPLNRLFESTVDGPAPTPPAPASALNGRPTDYIHISVGRRVLARFLNGIGSDVKAGQLALVDSIRFVRFEFAGVSTSRIPPLALASYLQSARPLGGPLADRYLFNPEADAFVLTDVLQSDAIRVLPLDVGNDPVPVDIAALQASLGDRVEVSARRPWIQFHGSKHATVAFKCYRFVRKSNGWTLFGLDQPGGGPSLIAPGSRVPVRQGTGAGSSP
jgi:hypothetical protein